MDKISVTALVLSILIAAASSAGDKSGYALVINHVPGWGWKKGGLGIGKSIRYDIRQYPEAAAKASASLLELLKASELPAQEFLKSKTASFFPFGIPFEKE